LFFPLSLPYLAVTGNWELTTKLSTSFYNLAVEYFNQAKYSECKHQLEAAIDLNHKISEYYSLKGKAEYYLGLYHEAYEDFNRCLELNPDNNDIRMRLMQFDKTITLEHLDLSYRPRSAPLEGIGKESVAEIPPRAQTHTHTHARARPAVKKKPGSVSLVPLHLPVPNDDMGYSDLSRIASREQLESPIDVTYCSSLLPIINPHLAVPMLAHTIVKKRQEELRSQTHVRTCMHKGDLWSIAQDAQKNAEEMRQPLKTSQAAKSAQHIAKKKPPVSSIALKRLSEEISRKAMLNPVVGGVVTCKSDPMLLAFERGEVTPGSSSAVRKKRNIALKLPVDNRPLRATIRVMES
jgi:tetratricopeptide (TPR) repeat protein